LPEDYESEVLAPFKETLIQHITRSLQFFYSSSHFNYVDQLFLAGGVSALEGLVDEVEQAIGLPAAVANPLANMQLSKSINASAIANDAPALLLAVGLAMSIPRQVIQRRASGHCVGVYMDYGSSGAIG
jgi:type IV pilus assembly protein PilM